MHQTTGMMNYLQPKNYLVADVDIFSPSKNINFKNLVQSSNIPSEISVQDKEFEFPARF